MPGRNSVALATAPTLLSTVRLVTGPVYFFLGDVPARPLWLVFLASVAATDLLDGWLARRLGVSTAHGALLDTAADKVFAASLLLQLWTVGVLSGWLVSILVLQYSLLPVVNAFHARALHVIPKPDWAARMGATLAIVTVFAGLLGLRDNAVASFGTLTAIANVIHLGTRAAAIARVQSNGSDATI